jgi:hypothetical protein
MNKNDKILKIRLGKKTNVQNDPKEYRVFTLNKELVANTQINSVSFYTSQPGPDAPVYLKLILTLPTEQVLPHDPARIPLPEDKRSIPIFVPAEDICPTVGVNVLSSSGNVGTNSTQLEIHLDSGGKVPGGVGIYFSTQ